MPYRLADTPGMVSIETAAGRKSPVEVSAEILQVLRDRAEAALGGEVVGRGDHGAGVFRRCAAPGHQGRRPTGGPARAAPAERTDCGGHRLRLGPRLRGDLRGLRPGRRHLRHFDAALVARRLRGAGHRRRFDAGRRRLRPGDRRVAGRAVCRRHAGAARPAAAAHPGARRQGAAVAGRFGTGRMHAVQWLPGRPAHRARRASRSWRPRWSIEPLDRCAPRCATPAWRPRAWTA